MNMIYAAIFMFFLIGYGGFIFYLLRNPQAKAKFMAMTPKERQRPFRRIGLIIVFLSIIIGVLKFYLD